jgi:hypothetical protein
MSSFLIGDLWVITGNILTFGQKIGQGIAKMAGSLKIE